MAEAGVASCREKGCKCEGFEANKFRKHICVHCYHECTLHEGLSEEAQALAVLSQSDREPCLIEPGLYMGNMLSSMNLPALRAARVTHVLNCAGKKLALFMPKFRQFPEEFVYLNLDLVDSTTQDLATALPCALEFIQTAMDSKGCVLVHCAQGVSRSGAVVVAWLMQAHALTYDEALARARKGRIICQPNSSFERQLRAWASTPKLHSH